MTELNMDKYDKVIKGLECCCKLVNGMDCNNCQYGEECKDPDALGCVSSLAYDALELLKEHKNAIKEIEERKAFNLKCDGQPEWLRKGIDVGFNTALDILKSNGETK